ncbi:hypothetical protein WJX79_010123 [Trebouxia sp. C0005]
MTEAGKAKAKSFNVLPPPSVPPVRGALLRTSSIEILESLNCPIVEYNQLQIKRKIGDGSIGLVYLGKWQETDVAVKVLIEMQHLAPDNEVQPQDPATLEPWINSEEDNHPSQGGTHQKKAANGLIGLTASTLARNSDPVLNKEETQAIKTLEREVSIMASLRHPNVVMFMGMCVEPPCIITEFCARGSLFDVLRKARTSPAFAQQLDWSKRLSMALDAAKGVLHLHSHKPTILHRDLKSPNMLVERHWRVKVTDFNLSRMVQTSSAGSSITSLLANNPRWLAPEVVSDHNYSKAADVYSFGIIMWEMMTWDMPWEELNPFQIMLRLQAQDRPEIPPLHTLPGQPLPGIADYIKLMQVCWSEDPSKRPGFEHVIVSIRGLLEGASSKQKLQKTLIEVPRLATSSMVPPNLNKLPVVGQTPYKADGPDPQQTPTPLQSSDKQTPLQIYETDRPFFGSAPVGGLDILCSHGKDKGGQMENMQYHPVSGMYYVEMATERDPGARSDFPVKLKLWPDFTTQSQPEARLIPRKVTASENVQVSAAIASRAMTVVRIGLRQHRRKHAVHCPVCLKKGTQDCQICKGQMQLDWSPFKDPQVKRYCLCPACSGHGQQNCLNCNGEGIVAPF